MSGQENKKLVQKGYESFKAGRIDDLLALLSDDVEWHLPDIENVPFAGRRQGREQVGQFFASVGNEQEVLEFEPKEYIAEGEKVVVLGHYAWRVASTGRKFEGDWAHVFTVRDGQIIKLQEYSDTAVAVSAYRR